jgi:hypothetical protein
MLVRTAPVLGIGTLVIATAAETITIPIITAMAPRARQTLAPKPSQILVDQILGMILTVIREADMRTEADTTLRHLAGNRIIGRTAVNRNARGGRTTHPRKLGWRSWMETRMRMPFISPRNSDSIARRSAFSMPRFRC